MKIGNKITKTQAIKALNNGQFVGAIASKLNPYAFNNAFVVVLHKDYIGNNAISESWINQFKYYNCNKESGQGISFYEVSEF